MKKAFEFFRWFLLMSFIAVGATSCLSSCSTTGMIPTQELSPLQDAYSVRDSIIIGKTALVDAWQAKKINKSTYDSAWKSFEDADKLVSAQIANARNDMVVKQPVVEAQKKVDEAKAEANLK